MTPGQADIRPVPVPRHSLRLKLTLWVIAIAVVTELTFGLVIAWFQRAGADQYLSERLERCAVHLAGEIRQRAFRVSDAELAGMLRSDPMCASFDRVGAYLYDAGGRPVASSDREAPAATAMGVEEALSVGRVAVSRRDLPAASGWGGPGGRARVASLRLSGEGDERFVLVCAGSGSGIEEVLRPALKVLMVAIPLSVLVSAIAAWLVAGLAVAPLRYLRGLARVMTPEKIEEDPAAPAALESEPMTVQRELQEARTRLREALHAQDRFLANVSHELKTPIAVLLAESQTLPKGSMSEEGQEFVKSVTQEMQRLGRTIDSFMMLTRIRSGRKFVGHALAPLNDLVMEAVVHCAKLASQHEVSVVPTLAPLGAPAIAEGDWELLRVMFVNLLRNAIRFSPRGAHVLVRVEASESSGDVLIRDFGPRVPEPLMPLIFQQHAQMREQGGRSFGLGVVIAQGIAELHGGQISIRNMPDAGCEFLVRLPRHRTDRPGQESSAADSEPAVQVETAPRERELTPPTSAA